MTPPKPRADARSDEQRIADLDRSLELYAVRRPTQGGRAAASAIARATALACMVRDESADTIGDYLDALDREQLYALTVALAAMVDPDDRVEDRLAWLEPLGVELERQAERERKRALAAARRQDTAA